MNSNDPPDPVNAATVAGDPEVRPEPNTVRWRVARRVAAVGARAMAWYAGRYVAEQMREDADAMTADALRHFHAPTDAAIQRGTAGALTELTAGLHMAVAAVLTHSQAMHTRKVQQVVSVQMAKGLEAMRTGPLAAAMTLRGVPFITGQAAALLSEASAIVAKGMGLVLCHCEQCGGEFLKGDGPCSPCCNEHAAEDDGHAAERADLKARADDAERKIARLLRLIDGGTK